MNGISMKLRGKSPRTWEPRRPDKLVAQIRKAEASVERLPELLPARCPSCGSIVGLVGVDGELLCRAWGVWAAADSDLLRIGETA